MWQAKFEKYRSEGFTIVGLALDAQGIEPARRYYDRFGVTFPSLVDPNYATGFGAVPKTFFVDECGVVMEAKDWEQRLGELPPPRPVPEDVRSKWTSPGDRFDSAAIAELVAESAAHPADLRIAAELGSRYLLLGLRIEAQAVLQRAASHHDARRVALEDDSLSRQLGHVYLQLTRASEGNGSEQVRLATLSYYLNPSVGFGKQIARIIAPEKFDDRPSGDFDNGFREATLARLKKQRSEWLSSE